MANLASKRNAFLYLFVGYVLALLPLLFVSIPPSVDYPNHLARIHILANWTPDSVWAHFYEPKWGLFGNLGLDAVAIPLARIIGTVNAGLVFWFLTISALFWGAVVLHRALAGSFSPLAALPTLAIYGCPVAYGFVNYAFGTGLCLLGTGLHIHLRNKPLPRILVCLAFTILLFFSHLMALGYFLLLLFVYEIFARRLDLTRVTSGNWRWAAPIGSATLALALSLASKTTQETGITEWWGLQTKLKALALTFNSGFFAPDMVLTATLVLTLFFLLWKRVLIVSKIGAAFTAVLFVLFLVSPYRLRGIDLIDFRMSQAIALTALCSLRTATRAPMAATIILIALAIRAAFVSYAYKTGDNLYAQLREDLRGLPKRSVLVGAGSRTAGEISKGYWLPPLHLAYSLSILDGQAYISQNFMEASSHPMELTELGWKLRYYVDVPDNLPDPKSFWAAKAKILREKMANSEVTKSWPGYFVFIKAIEEDASASGLPVFIQRDRYAILQFK